MFLVPRFCCIERGSHCVYVLRGFLFHKTRDTELSIRDVTKTETYNIFRCQNTQNVTGFFFCFFSAVPQAAYVLSSIVRNTDTWMQIDTKSDSQVSYSSATVSIQTVQSSPPPADRRQARSRRPHQQLDT